MSQTHLLHRRIRSVRNAKQITKAMEVVAASRMRRVAEQAVKTKVYAALAQNIVAAVSSTDEARHNPYFLAAEKSGTLYVIFSSDRGLAGAYNSNITNDALSQISTDQSGGIAASAIVFGRKGARFFSRLEGLSMVGEYEAVEDVPAANFFAPVLETIIRGISDGIFSRVKIIYTSFISPMNQRVLTTQLFPVFFEEQPPGTDIADVVYEFEPSIEQVVEESLRIYIESSLMAAKVDAAASEYAMRMMAMGNANRNASELIDDLTLELNASRQASITAEIAEITGGANAISR